MLEQLAMNQAAYVVCKILQRFDSIQSVGGESTVKTSTDITTKFLLDKKMRFHLASSDTPG